MRIRSIACILTAVILLACLLSAVPSAAAETVPMTWKPYDKAYVTIVFDDNKADLGDVYDIVHGEYDFPMCAAVPTATLPRNLALLHTIEANGGEILAHGHHHIVLNDSVSWATVVSEFSTSYKILAENGFNVHGTITCGGGGSEDNTMEYRAKIEPVLSRYYDYCNAWGVSTQYNHGRISMKRSTAENKKFINDAIENKEWLVLYAHHLDEVPPKLLRSVLDYLKEKQNSGELEVITYRDLHKRFANWASPVDLDSMPILETTTTASTTSAPATTTTTSSKLQHSKPTYLTTTTTTVAADEIAPETTTTTVSTPADIPADTDADKPTDEKTPAPWILWVIGGAAAVICAAGVIILVILLRKKRTPPTE